MRIRGFRMQPASQEVTMRIRDSIAFTLACFCVLALPLTAPAQYEQDFEGLSASPAGVILTGQDDYYLPTGPPGDTDFKCYTYAGNALGIVQNPAGGAKFIGGTGPGGGTYARAQRDVWMDMGVWEVWYDFCGIYTGAPPGSNNVGSMSMRLGTNTVHINLLTWVDPNNPTAINSTYVYYDANNVQSPIPGTPPGPEWSNLNPNHWYRALTVLNVDTNLITEVRIRDLTTGTEAVYIPTNWYMYGGSTPQGPPEAIRWFGGGGTVGNSTAWDNALIELQPAGMGACCVGENCQLVTGPECQELGGVFHPEWDSCGPPNPCQTAHVCCIGTECQVITEDECGALGGLFHPEWDSCGPPNPCEQTPVDSETWGSIKSHFR
jgi:hypothetical protein